MSDQSSVRVEYKVRPVTRYIVTRYHETSGPGGDAVGCECKGEFDNPESAYQVGYALAKHDHELLGYPLGDERIQYPERPPSINEATAPASQS